MQPSIQRPLPAVIPTRWGRVMTHTAARTSHLYQMLDDSTEPLFIWMVGYENFIICASVPDRRSIRKFTCAAGMPSWNVPDCRFGQSGSQRRVLPGPASAGRRFLHRIRDYKYFAISGAQHISEFPTAIEDMPDRADHASSKPERPARSAHTPAFRRISLHRFFVFHHRLSPGPLLHQSHYRQCYCIRPQHEPGLAQPRRVALLAI